MHEQLKWDKLVIGEQFEIYFYLLMLGTVRSMPLSWQLTSGQAKDLAYPCESTHFRKYWIETTTKGPAQISGCHVWGSPSAPWFRCETAAETQLCHSFLWQQLIISTYAKGFLCRCGWHLGIILRVVGLFRSFFNNKRSNKNEHTTLSSILVKTNL